MLLVNPFTGMILNANPKGCNQWSGPICREDSWNAIRSSTNAQIVEVPDEDDETASNYYFANGSYHPKEHKIEMTYRRKGNRITLAHEIGHSIGRGLSEPVEEERRAWKWVMKNRKKLAISKRKIRQLIRDSEYGNGLPRNTLLTRRPA